MTWASNPRRVPEEILKVEEVTVAFGGFKAINDLNFSLRTRRAARRHRPQRRRQDDAARRHHRQDAAALRQGLVPAQRAAAHGHHRPAGAADRPAGHRPQVPDAQRLQKPDGAGEPAAVAEVSRAACWPRWPPRSARTATSASRKSCDTIGLGPKAYRTAGILAHGEKQWLELGMLMAQDPELLLVDEPVAGMTPRESERTGELLMALAKKHTLLVIDHDMTFVRQIASRVTVLHEGKTLCEGRVARGAARPARDRGLPRRGPGGACSKSSNLSVAYGETLILRDVSLEVGRGEVVCLMGRNGVGKTTLLKSVMGLLRPRAGHVSFDGPRPDPRQPRRPRPRRHRLRAAGPRDLSAADGAGKPARSACWPTRNGRGPCPSRSSSISRC